ncbi:hypothetical protein H0H92_002405 [Tricholoma furcatifolium]|nr:hypothetical protein H0H92_002405 [Tricholoma furcatifolium]
MDDKFPKKKKSKMHQCSICKKLFPRPSGLKTHMNTHTNLKRCTRTFTVRSNAKRHLRTHGVEIMNCRDTPPVPYSVGFEPPSVLLPPSAAAHEMTKVPFKLRWVPPSLTTRTNAASLVSISDDDTSDDEYMDSAVDVPLPSILPSSVENGPDKKLEERNPIEAPAYPYHSTRMNKPGHLMSSAQFLALSGPGLYPQLSASLA